MRIRRSGFLLALSLAATGIQPTQAADYRLTVSLTAQHDRSVIYVQGKPYRLNESNTGIGLERHGRRWWTAAGFYTDSFRSTEGYAFAAWSAYESPRILGASASLDLAAGAITHSRARRRLQLQAVPFILPVLRVHVGPTTVQVTAVPDVVPGMVAFTFWQLSVPLP